METKTNTQNQQALINGGNRLRRFGLIVAGIGLGSALAYLITKSLGGRSRRTGRPFSENVVDDRGTGQEAAVKILRNLRDRGFEASDEKLALALGRPVEEVMGWSGGNLLIDDDVVMKARGIALHRGVHIE